MHQLDIRSPDVVDHVARQEPEVIFHLAAQAAVPVSVTRPVYDAIGRTVFEETHERN